MKDLFRRCLVPLEGTLRDALEAIERGKARIAMVVDRSGRLAGILVDGDVRRALLAKARLEGPLAAHMRRRFTAVGLEAGRAEVLDLMQARTIEQIPVLDRRGHPIGLHLMHQMLGAVERPNVAVIMAGGLGTRLKPITDLVPKPMVLVAGRPILERIILHLVGFGIRRILLAINHLGHVIRNHFGDGQRFGCRITYLVEKTPLGTGGPLSMVKPVPADPVLVLNGDLVTQVDVGGIFEAHQRGGQKITVGLRPYAHTIPYGCVERKGGRILSLVEKPRLLREVNAGIYVIDPSLFRRIPRGREYPLTSLIEDCLSRRVPVGAYEVDGDWIDVGQHDHLRQAREGKRADDGL